MTSEQRRQESEDYWFRSQAARNVLEDFVPTRRDDPTILDEEGQEPEPVTITPETNLEDVVRNAPEPPPQEFTNVYDFFSSQQGQEAVQEKFKERGIEGYEVAEAFPRAPRGFAGEARAGFARGIDQTQAMGFGLLGLMGEALEVEGLSDLGVEGYKRNMEEAAKNMASVQDPFEEIGGVGDAALYATGILTEQLPQLLLSLLGGGIGGIAAKTVAKKVIANEIGKRVAAGMAKDEAEKVVAKLVAQRALQGFDVPVVRGGAERVVSGIGQEAMQTATKAGAFSGAYVANVGQIAGGSFGEIEEETGLRDPVNALGFALLGGALETGAEALMVAPVASKLIGRSGTGGFLSGRGAEAQPLGFNLGPGAQTAVRLAATPPVEGLTEYGQTFTEQAAVASADPDRTLAEVAFTPEAERERRIAGAAGFVAGGGYSAAGQAASYLIPETSRAVQRKLSQTAPTEEDSQPTVLTGDWSQPVQVDDVTMQRNSSGLWVAINPDEKFLEGFPRVQAEDGTPLLVISPEVDERGRAAFLVARAEKALSDLSEGDIDTQVQTQTEPDVEDELGDAVELSEETEATRLRQSPQGAVALRDQLAEQEEVSAALAEPVAPVVDEQPIQPSKSAEESAQTIAAELDREEELRRSDEGAQGLRAQLAEQEEVSSALADPPVSEERGAATILKSASESAAAIQAAENAERTTANTPVEASYLRRRLAFEESQSERQKGNDEALARPQTQAAAFVEGLQTGQRVGLLLGGLPDAFVGSTGVFVGRRKNGNAVFEASELSPVSGDPIGPKTRVELKPSQFNRVILAPPPQPTRTPLEQAFDDALGPNPTKQQAERVLGSPYTGTRGAQKSTFSDGLGSEPFPIEISWFNKKGDKGTIIPSIRGTFTNSPFTTVRQMNQGLEVVVPDNQLGSLSKDIQVEAVSDKKGGRKNIVTGVNLWGRTYRRSLRSPKDFSVDLPLTSRGALSRKQGLLLFDNIYKNSPERIARSQAAVRGAQERQTPPEQMLREWELVQAGLNPVEYTFYEDALGRATDFINRSNLPENVKDEARFEAQNSIVKAFGNRKKRRGKQPEAGTTALAKTYLEELAKLRDGRLQKTRERATRLIGNVERDPERMSDLEQERGSIAGPRAAEIEERVINEAERGNEVDLDRAVEATLKRLAKEQPNRKAKEVFNTRASLRAIAESYKNIGKFNPIYTAMNAVRTADRSIRRREMNEQTELITDREARELASRQQRDQDPATTQEFAEGEIALAQRAETMQTADRVVLPEQAEPETEDAAPDINPDDPMLDQVSDARERFFNLTEEDQVLVLSNRRLNLDERGRPIRGQKSNLTSTQKRRAKQIEQYLQRKLTYANLYPESPAAPQQPRRGNQPAAQIPVSRFGSGEVLAGVAESVARGRPRTDTQGRPEGMGGPDREGAGTVQGADNVRDGGSGVRAPLTPQTVRELSRAAKLRFVQSFGRLTNDEAAVLTQGEIDRAYTAIVTRKDPASATAGRTAISQTPNSLADLAGLSGSQLLEGAVEGMRTYQAEREMVAYVRDNVGELLRSRAFADPSTFLDAVTKGRASRDMKIRANEFLKLIRRGVDLNNIGVQIGRFGGDTSWAGFITRRSNNTYDIAINLDSRHDRESAINTFLHELQHAVVAKKVNGEIKLNKVERDALQRLEKLRREAVVAAARDRGINVPNNPTEADITRLSRELGNIAQPSDANPSGDTRVYGALASLEEFAVEVSGNPELAGLMARLGFGEAKGRVTLLNAIRDAWNALVELVSGIKADPNSPLAKAFKDSWILNFANAGADMNLGDYTMPEVRRSAINREQARLEGIQNYIDSEVAARNLAGTTEERNAILNEMFEPSVTANAARVQSAANRLTQDEFVQWAQDNGFNFLDPVEVYNNNRTPEQAAEQQATGDTVQVAESRAVDPNDLIQVGRLVRVTARDANGTRFRFFARPGTDSTMMETPVRVFQETDKDGSTVNRTRVVQADLIENEQPLAMSKTYGEWVPAPVQGAESRAKPRVWKSTAETTFTGGTYQPGGMFSVDELLDNRAGDMDRARRQKLKEGEYRAREAGVYLNKLIKQEYGDNPPLNILNDAIGNLDNPMTDAQRAEVATLRETDEEAATEKAIEFISANRERFRRERQLPALQQLPAEIAEAAREMSNAIAELSQRAIDLGIVRGDMAATFAENLGIALTRSYSIFSDPKWVDKLRREDKDMGEASRMGIARQYIRGMMLTNLADQARAEATERGTPISREEAERRAKDGISNEQVDAILEGYLAVAREEPSIETLSGSVPGRKRMKGLTPRGNLAPEIRALWGQVENPAINFATTYLKLKTLVANQEFLNEITSFGKKEGWVYDPEDPRNRGDRHPPGYVQITGAADKTLDPLGGLYLHPLLARGLTEMFPVGSTAEHYWWVQKLMQATGLSMAMQTVGSVVAQVRNYLGNYFPMVAAGNLGVGDILNGNVKKNLKFAHEAAFAAAFRRFGGDRKKWVDLVGEMYREGLMGESISVGLINDLTQLGKLSALDNDAFSSNLDKLVKRPIKKTWNKAMLVYSMGDDIFKVFTAFMEMDKYRRAFPNMSEAEIRKGAIKRARDIHWTYSLAPQIVQDLKKFPFIAPFVTFTTEVIRTTVNLAKLAKSEIQEGRRTGNQELENIGWQRVRGMTTVAVLPAGLGTLAMAAAGISGDDLEDLRRFLPDWQKNSQLIPFKKANGEISYIDISYLDPYETWKKPVTALMRGLMNADRADEIITEGVVGMAMQALDPFTSEQIFAGAVMDVIRNNTASGRQVYNPQDSGTAIAENIAKQLVSPFIPGTGRTADRILKAAAGSTSESGRDYELSNEVLNLFTGQRISAVNVEQALGFKTSRFLRNRRDARSIFSREFTSRGTRTGDDVISGYQRANQSLRDLTAEMRRDYVAAINLGLPVNKASTILRSGGLDRDTARAVRTGIYRRLTPSQDQRKLAPKDRISALNRVLAETPDREALP